MPIIVGVPRSGTTLLRVMLDAHPEMSIPPETGFALDAARIDREAGGLRDRFVAMLTGYHTWQHMRVSAEALRARVEEIEPFDVAEGLRAFYRLYAERFGCSRYGDKTPLYRAHMGELEELLPEARFIHIIRDGRDVALSVRGLAFAPGEDMATLAHDWSKGVRDTREQGKRRRGYLEVRFDDLILDPETELRRICELVRLDFAPGMLRYTETARERLEEIGLGEQRSEPNPVPELAAGPPMADRIGHWRQAMTKREREEFERVAGETLEELGYA